jgi:hypothetical protein
MRGTLSLTKALLKDKLDMNLTQMSESLT